MKKSKLSTILSALVMIAVGAILFLYTGDAVATVLRILGIGLLVIGAVGVLSYFLQKDSKKKRLSKLLIAAVELICGIVILANPAFVLSLYPVAVGVLIALDGIGNLVTALQMKKDSDEKWKLALILSLIAVVLGIVIICNPFAALSTLVRVMGIVLIYEGACSVIVSLLR